MADTVVNVQSVQSAGNGFSVSQRMEEIRAAKYPNPPWVPQGTGNYIVNSDTGEAVNLYQEAELSLEQDPRSDAVATVRANDGSYSQVFVTQDDVKSVGGDMGLLKYKIQATLDAAPPAVPKWIWVVGGLGLFYMLTRRG